MSCGLALATALLLSDPNVALAASQPPASASALASVAAEPLFADIVARSGRLKSIVDGWTASGFDAAAFSAFKPQATELAALDMQGHLILKERGTDGDLKCILRGISEDLPVRVAAIEAASSDEERAVAMSELSHLLEDNAAVITAPPAPEV